MIKKQSAPRPIKRPDSMVESPAVFKDLGPRIGPHLYMKQRRQMVTGKMNDPGKLVGARAL
jgi:hypothetical protein